MSIFAIIRSEVSDMVGLFECTLRRNEDHDVWLRAAATGLTMVVNEKPLGGSRRRAGSLSADAASMLRGTAATLMQLRDARLDHAGDVAAIDAPLARWRRRELLVEAREAVIHGDVSALEQHLATPAASSGAGRYRVPRQVAAVTPPAVFRWAYALEQILAVRRRARRISMLCIWP